MSPADCVTYVALTLSIICFLVFVAQSLCALRTNTEHAAAKREATQAMGLVSGKLQAAAVPTVSDLTDLLNAFSKVLDSFTKAGPAVVSMGASILFLLIAAIASGAFQGSQPKIEKPAVTQAGAGQSDSQSQNKVKH